MSEEPSTIFLVARAKGGDREAWQGLLDRYYEKWLALYHGDLGSTIRRLYDTQDLVQSAVAEAMDGIGELREDAAFFTWVTSIIRHKIAKARRRLEREVPSADPHGSVPEPPGREPPPDEEATARDQYLHTVGVILDSFPDRPEAIAAVVMRFLDGCAIEEMGRRFGRPRRTVYRWLREGTEILKARLGHGS